MPIVKMETESVRGMTVRLRSTADDMETHLTSIKASVKSAGWQSQAREEFVMDLEMLVRMSQQSLSAMRMMSQAVDRKTDQWEAISQVFYGPFYFIENIWDSALGFLSNSWEWVIGGIGDIHWPTLPSIVIPSITIPVIIGGVAGIMPDWDFEYPPWWLFQPKVAETPVPEVLAPEAGGDESKGGESAPSDGVAPESVDVPYPTPPKEVPLEEAQENHDTCVWYARKRRPDLESTQSNNDNWADVGGAANYIGKYEDTAFQLDGDEGNLENVIAKGYAVVWEKKHLSDKDYGHVGIVEEVHADYVVVSESIKTDGITYHQVTRKYDLDYLSHEKMWLIP